MIRMVDIQGICGCALSERVTFRFCCRYTSIQVPVVASENRLQTCRHDWALVRTPGRLDFLYLLLRMLKNATPMQYCSMLLLERVWSGFASHLTRPGTLDSPCLAASPIHMPPPASPSPEGLDERSRQPESSPAPTYRPPSPGRSSQNKATSDSALGLLQLWSSRHLRKHQLLQSLPSTAMHQLPDLSVLDLNSFATESIKTVLPQYRTDLSDSLKRDLSFCPST
ncbi:hypothetical protein QBC35DRAFT_506899 [Podospora australis]|uniref:Uncharacterized protein n=1 Tax=Podospora australis TaxID=1536484 RepID=A0AAN6WLE2_9PEZI|nr:hypothetical protein QBC35DRAFT_506899 [Podospora australis]